MDDSCRPALVEALDDLGEGDQLSYAQRTAADIPYPPSVVEERLATLQRQRSWLWGVLAVAAVGTIGGATISWLDWEVSSFLIGLLPGAVAAASIAVQRLVYTEKAVQLYAVLHQVDDAPAPASAPAMAAE